MIYIVCILLMLFGISLIMYPDLYFKADTMFIVKDGTPTEYYLTKIRMYGTILVVGGILTLFIAFIYNIDWYAIL